MKKYIHPLTEILKSEYVLMAGQSLTNNDTPGSGNQLTNESVFDETEDVDPSKGKGFWDDAN